MNPVSHPHYNYAKTAILAALSGFLMALCFPNTNYYFISFFGLVPLTLILMRQPMMKALVGMLVFVCVYFGWLMNWVTYFHFIAYPGTVLGVFIMYGLATVIYKKTAGYFPRGRIVLIALVFTSLEYLRTIGFLRFPYGNIGYALGNATALSQIAEWTGHLGLSFLLYLVNALFAEGILQGKSKWTLKSKIHLLLTPPVIAIIILIGAYFLGHSRLPSEKNDKLKENKKVKIALLQPWFDFNQPWTEAARQLVKHKMFSLSRLAKPFDPDLIIWPETALLNYYEFSLQYRMRYAMDFERFFKEFNDKGQNIQFLIGTLGRTMNTINRSPQQNSATAKGTKTAAASQKVKIYNNALLLNPQGGIEQRYSKHLLVPFAEWFPYTDSFIFRYLTFVQTILKQASASQFTPGTEKTLFKHPLFTFSVLICYEDCFGEFTRLLVKKGAQILVVLTNDAWSYSEKSERLHNLFSRFRAIENRKTVVRASNAGITCVIDPFGRIVKSLKPFKEDLLVSEVTINEKRTFYTQYGNVTYQLLTIMTLVLFLLGFMRSIVNKKALSK